MKKKLLFSLLVLTLITLPWLMACAEPAAEPALAPGPEAGGGPPPAPGPIPAPVPPAPGAPEIRFSAFMPPFAAQVQCYQEWIAKLAEATNGAVSITLYPASTLLTEDDAVSGVKRGIADIADVHPQRYPGGRPLTEILGLPFVPLGDAEQGYEIWMALYEKFPEMQAETNDVKILFRTNTAGYALHTKKEVRAPKDLKGVKIMASTELAEMMDNIGAAPISLASSEWYISLDRGVCEAMWMNWPGIHNTKCYEFLPYHTLFPSGVSMGMIEVIMNMDTWNKLSPESQKAIDDLSLWMTERVRQAEEIDAAKVAMDAMKAEGHTFITLTPAEEKVWFDTASPIIEEFIAEGEAKGLPARAVYEEALRLAGR